MGFLWSEPSTEDLARELMLTFLQPYAARSAHISVLRADASVEVISSFGPDVGAFGPVTAVNLWQVAPFTLAIRSRAAVVARSRAEVEERFPAWVSHGGPARPLIAVPLRTSLTTIGSWCASFEDDLSINEATGAMQTITDVLALYFVGRDFRGSEESTDGDASARKPTLDQSVMVTANELSERQATILRLLAAGLTYNQIARRIGFSHSTVRVELLKVYRMLGVSSRTDAVTRALALNLVDREDLGHTQRLRAGGGHRVSVG